ncbi:MAG: choice-of-anchor D domain-containing protein [Caldilinea sp. CFX5]|nr:choice-of-anchor D domain-containing protein [Caldilinea sp. CFX5]
MNQTTRRKPRHLLHCLITLVVIGCQIALPLGALMAAVQPTPQMATAAVRQIGLGDWLAQRFGDLTAKVQPLWGEPTSAQAATSYGAPVALLSTTHSATITSARTGLCTVLNCFITNSANVVDANTTNFGNISIPLGLVGGVYFAVDTNVTFPAGYRAGFLVDNGGGLIDLSLFSSFSIKTYLGGALQETAASGALLDVSLFGGANSNAISFVTSKAFDEVRLEAGSLVGALLDLDVYYAFVQQPTYSPAPGGVGAALVGWYKADAGITATDGQNVAQWSNQATPYHITQAATGSRPLYYSTTAANLLNFNPALSFDGGDGLNSTTRLHAATDGWQGIVVAKDKRTNVAELRAPLGLGDNGNDPGFDLQTDGVSPNGWNVWMDGSSPAELGGGAFDSTARLYNGNSGGANQQPQIFALGSANTAGGTGNIISTIDGFNETTDMDSAQGAGIGGGLYVGSSGGENWLGLIGEVLVYNKQLSAAELNQVNSYLALKYGITLDASPSSATQNFDYVLSDGTTVVWPGTSDAAYQPYRFDIAGIGRDDGSALDQRKSRSVNAGIQPMIDNGAAFGANKSFLVWGHNGQAANYDVSYTPSSFTPAAGYFRMNRVWKVQETGTVGNIVVQGSGADHLLVSSDPTFASGVTEIDMSSGNATVDFSNGQFFTFGKAITAPGAVVNGLVFWSKADDAGCTPGDACANWADRSLNGNPIETIGAMTLQAADAAHNFHPYFSSFSTANYFKDVNSSFATPWPPIDVTEVSVFAVARATSLTNDGRITGMDNDDNFAGEPGLSIVDGSPAFYRFSSGPGRVTVSDDVVVNTSAIFGARTAGTQLTVGLNGKHTASAITAGGGFAGDIFNIGYGTWDINGAFPGDIQEVIWYRTDVSNTERQRIESYLALKYGITLDQSTAQNYVAGDGTTVVWDAIAHAAYSNNIAGIGRDDASALKQKQATSTNPGFQPTIGLGTIAASNAANSNSFAANRNFLVWGSNNQAASYGVGYTPTSFTPAAGYFRMNRVWKVQETGTVGNVVVQGSGADHLLVSSDPTFATGVTEIAFSSGSATVNFTNGQFFTFGRDITAPGGVAAPVVWLRADSGANTTTDGAAVNSWVNNGSSGGTAGQLGTCTFPTFTANKHNFNPALTDNSTNCNGALLLNDVFPTYAHRDLTSFILRSQPDVTQQRTMISYSEANNFTTVEKPWYASQSANQSWLWWDGNYQAIGTFPAAASRVNGVPQINAYAMPQWTSGTHTANLYLNGANTTVSGGVNASIGIGKHLFISNDANNDNPSGGDTSEIISYDRILSATEMQRINSYLAIKYGITYLNAAGTAVPDYLAADGTTKVWDATANATYNNNIAGIGRDDASVLQQKQAKSSNSGIQPIIGLGTIAASNAANSSTFSANKSFLLWGDNNGAATLTAAYNGGSNNRLARVWKVQETGTVGVVTVVLPRSAVPTVGLRSLIVHSSDANFGTVDRTIPLTSQGGNYVATVNFNNGDFFTFSSSSTVPEINVTPTTIDFGTVNVGSTSAAQAATIQNQGDVSLSLTNIALSGADAARFAISSNNCGAALNAGASCTVQLTFTPTAAGNRIAQLVITSNDSDESTVNVALSGATPSSNGGGGSTGAYNLAVTKSASVSNATISTPFTYTITVLNKGTIAASNVVMTDPLPAGVTFGSANATGGGNCMHNSGTVTCTWPSLAGGASATVTISVTP